MKVEFPKLLAVLGVRIHGCFNARRRREQRCLCSVKTAQSPLEILGRTVKAVEWPDVVVAVRQVDTKERKAVGRELQD